MLNQAAHTIKPNQNHLVKKMYYKKEILYEYHKPIDNLIRTLEKRRIFPQPIPLAQSSPLDSLSSIHRYSISSTYKQCSLSLLPIR